MPFICYNLYCFPHYRNRWVCSLCLLRCEAHTNPFPHTSQIKVLFFSCILLVWSVKFVEFLKTFSQCLHGNGFSSLWSLMWFFKPWLTVNLFPHSLQINRFSPVCLLKWFFNDCCEVTSLLQILQMYFLPKWTDLSCNRRPCALLNTFGHFLQQICETLCLYLCALKRSFPWNDFPQSSQKYSSAEWRLRCE